MNANTLKIGTTNNSYSNYHDYLLLAGRVLVAALFLGAGFSKLSGFAGTVGYIESVGLPFATLLAAGTTALELGAGLALLVGWQTKMAAAVLAGFTLMASFLFHNYWAMPADQAYIQQLMFMKNLAIAGGLLILAASGSGKLGIGSDRA